MSRCLDQERIAVPDGKDDSRSLVSPESYEIRRLDAVLHDDGRRMERVKRRCGDDVNGLEVVET